MNSRILFVMAIIVLFVIACTQDNGSSPLDRELSRALIKYAPTNDASYFVMPQSDDYSALPNQDPNNPITKDKAILGKLLFFETGLAQHSLNPECFETYSCATCHVPSKGFLPGRAQGIADGAVGFGILGSNRELLPIYDETEIDAQGTRPLSVMNVTYVTNTLWSGTFGANDLNVGTEESWTGLAEVNHTGFAGLEAQNIENFELHRMDINERVLDEHAYRTLFDTAFPDVPEEERYSKETASFALSAYLRTLLTNEAPFQDYLKGDANAITESQKRGAILFFGKAGCAKCHNSPSFSAMKFYTLGTQDMYELGGLNTSADDPRIQGRGSFTGAEEDMFKFKVPQLYNLQMYETFFHGSSKNSLEEVIDFKLAAKSENPNVTDDMMAIHEVSLTETEKGDLIDFLKNALYDQDMDRYSPQGVLSGYCFPNNDSQSKVDLGCE